MTMTFQELVVRPARATLNWVKSLVRAWWRPLTQLGLAGTVWVNGVFLPLSTKTFPDMTALSLLVTSVVAAFGVRAWEKHKGME